MPASTAAQDAWKIGVARRAITPPMGCQMAGFDARKGVSEAVHDDLHARALVIDDGQRRIALISVEVIAVSAEFAQVVRAQIEAKTGIPAGNVFLCATHTHCGPVTMNHFFNQGQTLDEEYLLFLRDTLGAAVADANEDKKERRLKTGLVPCDGIAVNRRTEDGLPVDPYAGVLLVEELDGAPAAIAVIYACHTTVLGPNTLSITQDFPFYTLATLKKHLGDQVETLFFNGAEGDLSIGHKSNLSAVGVVDSFRTFETAQRLGERLAKAVLSGLAALTFEEERIQVVTNELALPLKQYEPAASMTQHREEASLRIDPQAEVRDTLAQRQVYLFARIEEYYARLYEASDAPEPKTLSVKLSAILLGETALLTLPGEVFVRIALAIREASPFPKTFFLGLTNDYIGYVPDIFATATSGYEVIASRVPASAGTMMEQEAGMMLNELKAELEFQKTGRV